MDDKIKHNGIVEDVGQGIVKVRILQTSACAHCKVASHCNAAEAKEKIIDVRCEEDAARYNVGQAVTVATTTSAVGRAMTVGFVVPFIVMVASLLLVLTLTGDEVLAALTAVLALIPYYLTVFLLRRPLSKGVAFTIEDSNENY